MLRKFTSRKMSLLVIFDNFSMNHSDKSYLKLIIDPFALLVPAVCAFEGTGSFSLALAEMAVEEVAVNVAIDALAV